MENISQAQFCWDEVKILSFITNVTVMNLSQNVHSDKQQTSVINLKWSMMVLVIHNGAERTLHE